jgi:hypothetical protein
MGKQASYSAKNPVKIRQRGVEVETELPVVADEPAKRCDGRSLQRECDLPTPLDHLLQDGTIAAAAG